MEKLAQKKILQTIDMFSNRGMGNNSIFIQKNIIKELNNVNSVLVYQHG